MLAAGFHGGYLLVSILVVQLVTAQAPKALQPSEGQVLLVHSIGRGKQMYVCQTTNGVPTWKFKAPEAELYSPSGELAGHHFAGPTWESTDGSRVVGKVIASAPSPDTTSVPWLLLTATAHEGTGVFSKVQSIQRLDTKGGVAPSTACTENQEKAVSYEASYYFYGTR